MAESSSVQEHTTQSTLLTIKPNQNLIMDSMPFKYDAFMLQIIECLKYSPLIIALTNVDIVPMSLLSQVYSSVKYVKDDERIMFEIIDKKTYVSKIRFCSLLGLPYANSMLNPNSITTARIFEIFYNMGYTDFLSTVAKNSLMSAIATFHITKIIILDSSKFAFIGSIPELMYRCVSDAGKIIIEYKKLPALGLRPLNLEMQCSIDEADKSKKGGKKGDKRKKIQEVPSSKLVTPKNRKDQMVEPSAPSSSDNDYFPSDQDDRVEHEKEHNESEDSNREDSPEVIFTKNVPSPPPSPKHTTAPISITPCSPPVSSQPPTSTPLPPPFFTETTTTTTTTTSVGPSVNVNTSDARMFLGEKDLISNHFISTTYFEAAVKGVLDTFVKEHVATLDKANKAVESSTQSCLQATEKVDKLIFDIKTFITEINPAAENNATNENDAIVNLNTSLQKERESIVKLRADIYTNNSAFQESISSRISKFQEDMAVESKIMDQLAIRTTQLKTQSVKLKHAQQELEELKFERTGIKSCVSDVNSLLSNLLVAHDPIHTITIRRHLAEKLLLAIAMSNRIEGVSEVLVLPEQGREKTKDKSKDDKGKKPIGDSDKDDDSKEQQLKRKARDHEIMRMLAWRGNLKRKSKSKKEAHNALEC
ncbi:hypothetical protein Lser_V15G04372 [Lactuca serriola]